MISITYKVDVNIKEPLGKRLEKACIEFNTYTFTYKSITLDNDIDKLLYIAQLTLNEISIPFKVHKPIFQVIENTIQLEKKRLNNNNNGLKRRRD